MVKGEGTVMNGEIQREMGGSECVGQNDKCITTSIHGLGMDG